MGIDLNKPVLYKHAALRFFKKSEYHVTRLCRENVLLMVYSGTLRFTENGEAREVWAGEYYIQEKNCYQSATQPSDEPKYLYIHFDAEWCEGDGSLDRRGRFDYALYEDLMVKIDAAAYSGASYTELEYLTLKLLLSLFDGKKESDKNALARRIGEYIEKNLQNIDSLSSLVDEFHYSKNYIIKIFKKEFGVSPFQYINTLRINRARYLLEATSKSLSEICKECGFADYSYFYKRFLQGTGTSPLRYRRQVQRDPLIK
jgi:AraC-like DNA-binding protein